MDNVDFLKKTYEAFARGDVPAVLEAMSPDIVWHEAEGHPYESPTGEPFVGPNAVMENVFMRIMAEWDGFTIVPQRYHAGGDSVVFEHRWVGTCKATGKRMDLQACHIWEVKNGKLTRLQEYCNTAKLWEIMQTG